MTGNGNGGSFPFLDSSVPNVARIYDCLLGGKDNFAVDRAAAAELLRHIPDALAACHANRAVHSSTAAWPASQPESSKSQGR
jgi:hypothetical protein